MKSVFLKTLFNFIMKQLENFSAPLKNLLLKKLLFKILRNKLKKKHFTFKTILR